MVVDSLGMIAVVFIVYMAITALMIFLFLFRKGRLVRNTFIFSIAQIYTLAHTFLKFTAAEPMIQAIIGRSFAIILALGAFACIYLKVKGNTMVNKISAALVALSLINLWFL